MCAHRDESAALTARALRQALMGCVWQAETVHVKRKAAFVFRAAAYMVKCGGIGDFGGG